MCKAPAGFFLALSACYKDNSRRSLVCGISMLFRNMYCSQIVKHLVSPVSTLHLPYIYVHSHLPCTPHMFLFLSPRIPSLNPIPGVGSHCRAIAIHWTLGRWACTVHKGTATTLTCKQVTILCERLHLFILMKRRCDVKAGFEEMLVSPAKRDQNEMGGLQKRDRFWCASYLWTYWCQRLENQTNQSWWWKVPKPEKRD